MIVKFECYFIADDNAMENLKTLEHHAENLLDLDNWTEINTVYGVKVEKLRVAENIDWDVDEPEDIEQLPKRIVIPEGVSDEDIGDFISDLTGFCHKGFTLG